MTRSRRTPCAANHATARSRKPTASRLLSVGRPRRTRRGSRRRRNVDVLPADAAHARRRPVDAMPDRRDAAQRLDVDVQELAGTRALVAPHGRRRRRAAAAARAHGAAARAHGRAGQPERAARSSRPRTAARASAHDGGDRARRVRCADPARGRRRHRPGPRAPPPRCRARHLWTVRTLTPNAAAVSRHAPAVRSTRWTIRALPFGVVFALRCTASGVTSWGRERWGTIPLPQEAPDEQRAWPLHLGTRKSPDVKRKMPGVGRGPERPRGAVVVPRPETHRVDDAGRTESESWTAGPRQRTAALVESSESAGGIGRSGRMTRKVVPRPGALSTRTVPPCSATAFCVIASPSPEPGILPTFAPR